MEKPKRRWRKALRITAASIAFVLLAMLLLPVLFPGKVAAEVKHFANERLDGELNFKEAKLSFFNHFPSLTLTLTDFSLKGSAPFRDQTLVSAGEIAFGINLKSLVFDGKVTIDKIYISRALIDVKVDGKGRANYNVYNSQSTDAVSNGKGTSMRLEKIAIEDSHIRYDDRSAKLKFDARGFNYVGRGALDASVFDLETDADIDSLDFAFGGEPYLANKEVHASLVTQVNTRSLAFVFRQNDLRINKLPVTFTGKFDFLRDGYDMDFRINSSESRLSDFFTALPPHYVTWLEKSKVKGTTSLALTLKGQYIASQHRAPDLAFKMKIRDGEIAYNDAPVAATNIFLNFDTRLPSLDVNRLQVDLDSLYLNVGKDYLKAIVKSEGLEKPKIAARLQASADLKKLNRALGVQLVEVAGKLTANLTANGVYDKSRASFPTAKGFVQLKNGWLKTKYYPSAVSAINLDANLQSDGTFGGSHLKIAPASFSFEGQPFFVRAAFDNFDDVAYDIRAKGTLDLARIYRVFSRKGLDLAGFIKADVAFAGKQSDATSGRYGKLRNSGTLILRNIRTKSQYLPKPFVIDEGTFAFSRNDMDFRGFKAHYGHSDFTMDGQMSNVINFVLSDRETLHGNFSLRSNYLNAHEFMAQTPTENKISVSEAKTAQSTPGVIVVPKNLDLSLRASASKVFFNGLKIENATGNLDISNGRLSLEKTGFGLIGCKVSMDADYAPETSTRAGFHFKVDARDFDIKKAYDSIAMFREMATAAAHAQGTVSLRYDISGKLGADMMPVYPSLAGGGVLSVKKVKMFGFKMLNAVGKKTGRDSISNPDVSKVDIKTTIKNNIMTIERFRFKVAGFRPRIEGTTSLDGKLNLKMRLGLPPLGIIGIPLTITGTQDNPKVRLGRKTEDLQETPYDPKAPQAKPVTDNPKPSQ